MFRRSSATAATMLFSAILALASAGPAAGTVPDEVREVVSFLELREALADPNGPMTVKLTEPIAGAVAELSVGADRRVDLNGQWLASNAVTVSAGVSLTIFDSVGGGSWESFSTVQGKAGLQISNASLTIEGGRVAARGGSGAAGIGGGSLEDNGRVDISGGSVTASGGSNGAGIGGGVKGNGGTVLISGGEVVVSGGFVGAGIGGGYEGDGGTIHIRGGGVSASGGISGAGIGGGGQGDGGTIHISGGEVAARSGSGAAAIGGAGSGSGAELTIGKSARVVAQGSLVETSARAIGGGRATAPFGTLMLAGQLEVLNAPLEVPAGHTAHIEPTGLLTGYGASGRGMIVNGGVIDVNWVQDIREAVDEVSGVTIEGNNYRLRYADGSEAQAIPVYGPTLQAVGMELRTGVGGGLVIQAWMTEPDGGGEAFWADSPLEGDTTLYPVIVPEWSFSPEKVILRAGEEQRFEVTQAVPFDRSDRTTDAEFSSTNETDELRGAGTFLFTETGDRYVYAFLGNYSMAAEVSIVPADPSMLEIFAPRTVEAGACVDLTATVADQYGNEIAPSSSGVSFTSDRIDDLIDDLKFCATRVGTRTLTAHYEGLTSSASLTVYPAGFEPGVNRLAGQDRFGTAVAVSKSQFSPGVPVVYIADGLSFPDALGAGPVAGLNEGPILLVETASIPAEVRAEVKRLRPARIVVLGGTGAVSDAVAKQLAALTSGDVSRLAGQDRFGTAVAVSKSQFSPGVPVVYIADGLSFPDALGAGPVAGLNEGPILLVETASIPAEVRAEVKRLRPARIVVLGGTGAVSDAVAIQLERILLNQ